MSSEIPSLEPHGKALGIIELLTRIGEDNIRLQNLVESATNFQTRKKGTTAITFLTDQMNATEVFHGKARHVGLVLWLPTELVEAAKAAHDKEATEGGETCRKRKSARA